MTNSTLNEPEKFSVQFSPLVDLPITEAESISPQGVDVWLLDLSAISIEESENFSTILSCDELERAKQFKRNQHHFFATRALLRKALSRYTRINPEDLLFLRALEGKPYLTNFGLPLYFNLSHSGNFAALAVSSLGEVGVDIEITRKRSYLKIVERFFHEDENDQINNCDEAKREELFYRMWTLKEAFFKATGMGISSGLDKACFYLHDNNIAAQFSDELNVQRNQWQFHQEIVAPKTVAALALHSEEDVKPHWFDGNLLLSSS